MPVPTTTAPSDKPITHCSQSIITDSNTDVDVLFVPYLVRVRDTEVADCSDFFFVAFI